MLITHNEDGCMFSLDDYCKINNLNLINEHDCFYQTKGNIQSIKNYFNNNFHNLEFKAVSDQFSGWEAHNLDDETTHLIIKENDFLNKINNTLKISYAFFMKTRTNTQIPWHYDYPRRGPVLNALLNPEVKSHSFFTRSITDTTDLIECKYTEEEFCLYNTDIPHSVINLDKPRYSFSLWFERGATDLSWTEAVDIIRHTQ